MYIIAAILIFGFLIAVHELGHFATAKLLGVQVNEFSIGMGPLLWSREKGETLYSIRALPIGGYCAMEGEDEESYDPRSFGQAKAWKKFLILVAGAAMNFLVGVLLCLILNAPNQAFVTPTISSLADGFPSQGEQGLMAGDRILSIDGERIYLYSDISLMLMRGDETLDLVVERNGEKVVLNDYPLVPQEYTINGKTVLQYGLSFRVEEATLSSRLANGWLTAVDFVRLVRMSLGDLLSGRAGLRDLSGPIGIVDVMSEVGQASPTVLDAVLNLVYFAALIAVNLAVMNLLPLPALDGGRIFFLFLNGLWQLVFRKSINPKYEGYVHLTGMALLMGLMLVVAFSDIGKLFGR